MCVYLLRNIPAFITYDNCTTNCVVPTQFNVTIRKQRGAMAPCLGTKQKGYFNRFPLPFQCVATLYCRPYLQKFLNYCTCAMRKKPRYTCCTSVALSYYCIVELSYCRIIVLSYYCIVGSDNTIIRQIGTMAPLNHHTVFICIYAKYGSPRKVIIAIIRQFHDGMQARVQDNGKDLCAIPGFQRSETGLCACPHPVQPAQQT